ncbi:hypothetical protein A0H81_08237 [Grifola frondosa]|uniref:Uncharacterized protein n=1 Tax=Grifola frondosa TaxID=5627 RepID=A0A1C7M4Q6_GRIFR|nr:hypothetical protein A0H81_08237 [Grifola frondosa]
MNRFRNMSRDELHGTLGIIELRWRDRQQFLESQGYMLRPRYHPDWSPSWRRTGVKIREAEDSIVLWARHNVIDATRIADGKLVYIKQVKTGDEETRIASTLSSEPLCKDPRNHCVPILDVLQDPNDKAISFLVMPFLRYIDDPNLRSLKIFWIVENRSWRA